MAAAVRPLVHAELSQQLLDLLKFVTEIDVHKGLNLPILVIP